MLDVRKLSETFIVRRKDTPIHNTHPLLKMFGATFLFVAIIIGNLQAIIVVFIIVMIESAIAKVLRNIAMFLWSIRIFLITMGILAFIFYTPLVATVILMRVITGGIIVACFILTTDNMDLAQALEGIKVPQKIIMATQFALRMIPLISKDATESAEALILRGEVSPRFIPQGITTMLALIIANAMERAQYLAEALEAKYFGIAKKRTYIRKLKITKYGVIQLIIKMMVVIMWASAFLP